MSERSVKHTYPTAPIAWMNQSFLSNTTEAKTLPSSTSSVSSFDRPESPTLPPEYDHASDQNSVLTINSNKASSSNSSSPRPLQASGTTLSFLPLPPDSTAPFYERSRNDPAVPPASAKHPDASSIYSNSTLYASNSITPQQSQTQSKKKHQQHLPDPMASAIELSISPNVPPAPAAGMYWSRAITYGKCPSRPLRAHSANLVGEHLYVFGGCDMKNCFNTLYILDMDTLTWSKPRALGQIPPPCRAHSSTVVEKDLGSGKKARSLYIFGGGDGPNYFNDLYVLNTDTLVWSKPKVEGDPPSPRRAHTTCLWNQKIIVVGGGDGARALADVHMLDISDPLSPKWSRIQATGNPPIARGYHTSNLVKDKLIVYGGSDGHECFSDVHVLDLVTNYWSHIDLDRTIPRLAHSATQVGSYVFVIGGHDGSRYSNDILLLNLVTMSWETRKIYGSALTPRGYHTSVLHDSRLYILGGYDGKHVFDDVYMLELSACAYLPQITNFEIDI